MSFLAKSLVAITFGVLVVFFLSYVCVLFSEQFLSANGAAIVMPCLPECLWIDILVVPCDHATCISV